MWANEKRSRETEIKQSGVIAAAKKAVINIRRTKI